MRTEQAAVKITLASLRDASSSASAKALYSALLNEPSLDNIRAAAKVAKDLLVEGQVYSREADALCALAKQLRLEVD